MHLCCRPAQPSYWLTIPVQSTLVSFKGLWILSGVGMMPRYAKCLSHGTTPAVKGQLQCLGFCTGFPSAHLWITWGMTAPGCVDSWELLQLHFKQARNECAVV